VCKLKVLFFSASIGNGHDQAANTIASEIRLQYPDAKVQVLDIVNTISPFLSRVVLDSYLALVKHAPNFWGLLHDQFATPKESNEPLELMNKVLANEVRTRITHFNPNIIINTHAFASTINGLLKQQKKISMPVATLITDYNLHSFWTHKSIDYFFVATPFIKKIITNLNFSSERVLATGLPVRTAFNEITKQRKSDVFYKLGLEEKKTLLFMGGGLGLGDIISKVKASDQEFENYNFLVACGSNKELYQKASSLQTKNTLIPLNFVDNIHEYMYISDCIITKPGGLTTTEAMILGKPMALISPIPGQETHNLQYFLNKGVAIALPNNEYAGMMLAELMYDSNRLDVMSKFSRGLVNSNATKEIVNKVFDLVK